MTFSYPAQGPGYERNQPLFGRMRDMKAQGLLPVLIRWASMLCLGKQPQGAVYSLCH